ncbi:MAG: hypothetical protein HY832_01700 [Candidatus Aenigmarchaeota archaeon]|nr:hypothetical protein [Candidatus Aenigmarchaeota archaeon]
MEKGRLANVIDAFVVRQKTSVVHELQEDKSLEELLRAISRTDYEFNVLYGDGLGGPRGKIKGHLQKYAEELSGYLDQFEAKVGISGVPENELHLHLSPPLLRVYTEKCRELETIRNNLKTRITDEAAVQPTQQIRPVESVGILRKARYAAAGIGVAASLAAGLNYAYQHMPQVQRTEYEIPAAIDGQDLETCAVTKGSDDARKFSPKNLGIRPKKMVATEIIDPQAPKRSYELEFTMDGQELRYLRVERKSGDIFFYVINENSTVAGSLDGRDPLGFCYGEGSERGPISVRGAFRYALDTISKNAGRGSVTGAAIAQH